jgi:hypothetical protein
VAGIVLGDTPTAPKRRPAIQTKVFLGSFLNEERFFPSFIPDRLHCYLRRETT